METVLELIANNAASAHWWFFLLLILAGLNLPISEDLIVLTGAVIASTIVPQNTYKIFTFIFLGCYVSDVMSYWIGRSLTPWLRSNKYLAKIVDNSRMDRVQQFYSQYGTRTLLVGRFIPFGVRNFLFMSAGMVRMKFVKFILVDGLACLLSNAVWFFLAYFLAEGYPKVLSYMGKANLVIFAIFIVFTITALCYKRTKRNKKSKDPIV